MKVAEVLAAIEQLDLRHQALLAEQELAAQRAKTDPTVRQLRQRRAALETQVQHQASQLKQLELEVAELAGRVKSHERAIYDGSVRHPADLQRRQHELETLRGKIQGLEESELSQMEAQERSAQELAGVGVELSEREHLVEQLRMADRSQAPELAGELSAGEVERRQLAESLSPSQLRTYERTAARRRPAVAKVVGGTCSGCRLPLPSRLLQEARGEQLVTCENCERILLL
ncbi:MAG TPA: C4-type zinc ribbon domain-containing protein [Candidatus Dormibacteraeota bacterium]|nr:C4-type zinc ribbon domain-containing protein [Candidatus Dormibacteraeota bacterium]